MPNFLDKLFGSFGKKNVETVPQRRSDPDATVPLPDLSMATRSPDSQATKPSEAPRRLILGIAQDVGKVRSHNEDVLLVFTGELDGLEPMPNFGVFIVADGMGGHSLGERASGIAARTAGRAIMEKILPSLLADPQADAERPALKEVMEEAMESANMAVFTSVPEGGTTLTCALMIGEQVILSHVGDSRAYLISLDTFEQVTRDHSLVQRLQELGQLSAAEAAVHPQRSVLYRAIGQGENLEVDIISRRLPPGAMLLLCSDGLWGLVPDPRIQEIVRQSPSPQAACEALVAAANAAGGPDNITAIMVQLPKT